MAMITLYVHNIIIAIYQRQCQSSRDLTVEAGGSKRNKEENRKRIFKPPAAAMWLVAVLVSAVFLAAVDAV
jgi:hypothetical protein